jgi:hypothetical protein
LHQCSPPPLDRPTPQDLEIAEAYAKAVEREREAERARIAAECNAVGYAVLPNLLNEETRKQLVAALRQDIILQQEEQEEGSPSKPQEASQEAS